MIVLPTVRGPVSPLCCELLLPVVLGMITTTISA